MGGLWNKIPYTYAVVLPSRNGRSTTATPPNGTGSGCWRSIAATSCRRHRTGCPFSPSPFRSSTRSPSRSGRSRSAGMRWPISAASCSDGSMRARWSRTSGCGAGRRRSRWCSSTISSSGSPSASLSAAAPATCCSTISPSSSQHPAEIFELWKGGMSFHGGFLGCVAAVILFCRKNEISDPLARRHHDRGRADRTVARAARQLHQQRVVGPAGGFQRALGDGVSQWRTAAAASQPALRGRPRRHPAVYGPGGHDPDGRAEAAGPDPRQLHRDLRPCAHHQRILPRARPAARIFVGRADHGYAVVGADDHCRSHPDRDGMAPRGAGAYAEVDLQGRP